MYIPSSLRQPATTGRSVQRTTSAALPHAPAFGHATPPNGKGKLISADNFLKTGVLMSAGNAVWLGIQFMAITISGALNGSPPPQNLSHHLEPPPAIVSHYVTPTEEASEIHHETAPHADEADHPEHDAHSEEEHTQIAGPETPNHAPHDVDENFFKALVDHMPLETTNDLIREIAQTAIIYTGLKTKESMDAKKAGNNKGPQTEDAEAQET